MVLQKSEINPNNTRFMSQWSVSLGFTLIDSISIRDIGETIAGNIHIRAKKGRR